MSSITNVHGHLTKAKLPPLWCYNRSGRGEFMRRQLGFGSTVEMRWWSLRCGMKALVAIKGMQLGSYQLGSGNPEITHEYSNTRPSEKAHNRCAVIVFSAAKYTSVKFLLKVKLLRSCNECKELYPPTPGRYGRISSRS
ncbi:hypothetical protein MLD38_030540 [Melastoma candidum]|uniref:Uncharacterized protein n=1 Tax=Melastoma candidum TaxID=119954 RepID=A0ACB9MM26_9MYRT|nr:hypothetical protein MLD38_030540 [Melastoma candidum]